jgi:hypothetical protein
VWWTTNRKTALVLVTIVGVCILAALVRAVPALESDNIYGFDPYVHYYFSGYTVEYGTFAGTDEFREDLVDDRGNWPGLHLLMGGTHMVTDADMEDLFRLAPLFLGALTVLLVFLIALRLYGMVAALFAAILFALADHVVAQSSWLIQGTVGLVILAAFILVVVSRPLGHRMTLAIIAVLFLASMVTHHFTHLILIVTLVVAIATMTTGHARRRLLVLFGALLPVTAGYWYWFGRQTGSFPDIVEQMTDILGSPLGIAAIIALAALVTMAIARRDRLPSIWERVEVRIVGIARRIEGSTPLLLGSALAVTIVAALLLAWLARTLDPVPGFGLEQVTKYTLVAFGWIGLVVVVAGRLPATRFWVDLLAIMGAGFILVVGVFTFLPLELRFFEFVYLPLSIMSGVGIAHLARGGSSVAIDAKDTSEVTVSWTPMGATLIVVGLLLIAMAVDDQQRMTSDLSERYYHSEEEILAAHWVAENTEPNAVIATPFGLQPVMFGIGERKTDTYVVARSIIEKDWGKFAWDVRVVGQDGPLYIVLTTDTRKYGKEEFLELDLEEDIYEVGGAFLREPRFFDVKYSNPEILILKVSANLTGVTWSSG